MGENDAGERADQSPEAERIYAQAIVDLRPGQALDLDPLCSAHPEHTHALRCLHDRWRQLRSEHQELGGSLTERLVDHYGADADPSISLQGQIEPASDFSSEVLKRLSGRLPTASRYKLEGEVARGGMGAILRVWDEDLRRHLAMKVVLGKSGESTTGDTPQVPVSMLARFLEEAQVTGQLDHPGIVPVHELGLDADGQVYFTMKLVNGKTLKEVFDELAAGEGGWTQTRVLGLLLKVCEAMAYAHDKDVIHRDLKPANVMVGKFGEVYVMDWGLAKILGRKDKKDLRVRAEKPLATSELRSDRKDHAGETPDSPLYTMDGDVVGTPAYMSPEQAAGQVSEMGPPSDVFAIGAMLYHLLAGHMPYVSPGARLNNYAIWSSVQAGPPRALHEVAPLVPAELVAICEKAMTRDAQARYANTSELAEDLSAYIEGRVVNAYETGAWAEARKWVGRNKALAGSLAASMLLAISGVGSVAYVQAEGKAAEGELRGIAEENEKLALKNEVEAQSQRDRAEAETAKVLRLSDVKVLQELEAEADGLWPAYPEQIPVLTSWLERAGALLSNLPGHNATLKEMRSSSLPWSNEERARDRTTHPRAGNLAQKQAELEGLFAQLEQGLTGEALDAADAQALELEPEVAALRDEVEARRSWSFNSPQEEWQHDVLAELVGNLSAMKAGLLANDATTPGHGWSIPNRLRLAQELEADFATGGEHALRWEKALHLIDEAYPGLDLTPQMGLVPIGADAVSGLWEFWHVQSGAEPLRDAAGKLVIEEDSGLVFVLLSGGTFWMGAQSSNPSGRNYDKDAESDEDPVHEVLLSGFFLSKYEMTQGQWERLAGSNPSTYGPGSVLLGHLHDLTHPVEQVSWLDCVALLLRAGLVLPSEAQWEFGARGGTDTVWWTGSERDSLKDLKVANLADQAAARGEASWLEIKDWPELDDGFATHAPVGEFAANNFGLYNVHGNVWEWCLDGYDVGFYGRSAFLDPVSPSAPSADRVTRGASFDRTAASARAANRNNGAPAIADHGLGLRPARAIDP